MNLTSLETDSFLDAVKTALLASADLPELATANVAVWHHGDGDPDEAVREGIAKAGGVAVLVYDLGGTADSEDTIRADAAVELYISPGKRSRKVDAARRLGGEIRDSIMRCLHRHTDLRNTAAFFDCKVSGYVPLADPEFVAWRITLSRNIYLSID